MYGMWRSRCGADRGKSVRRKKVERLETKTEMIKVRVTPAEKVSIQVKAEKQGVTVSDLLRSVAYE